MILRSVRTRVVLLFVFLLMAALRFAGQGLDASDKKDLQRYRAGVVFLKALTARSDALPETELRQAQDLLALLSNATAYWGQSGDSSSRVAMQGRRDATEAVTRLVSLFDKSSQVERLWIGRGAESAPIARTWPYGNGVLLLRVGRQELAPDTPPNFVVAQHDLSKKGDVAIDIGKTAAVYAMVVFSNAPSGAQQIPLRIRSAGSELAQLRLAAQVPPTGTLNVTVVDESGTPTPSVAGVYGQDNQLIVPDTALRFDNAGFNYRNGRSRAYVQAHYWPGSPQQRSVFFVDGSYSVRVPEGAYRLIAGKGTEYLPVSESVAVKAGEVVSRRILLKRWIDMPARGWYSGDGHVHFERRTPEANRDVMLWTQAEDVHVANVLRMGDAKETYFEQYGFGAQGRFISGKYALVPGQEDPRTNPVGHTMQLNLQKPIRVADRYYLYDLVFDETRRQGGLTGYAHVYFQPPRGFFVRRDMTLNIPRNKIDFAEICEFGEIGDELYYEFLNLGFPLTASAGSDVPWGNTIGTSRVYAYTGARFDADAWFAALKAGHTFVTTGTMLQFTVNGTLPGSVIEARRGDTLRIKVSAQRQPAPPGYVEVVAQGAVIRSVRPSAENQNEVSDEFTVPVRGSMWIAARTSGAHTTPVYVKVDGRRFWRLDQVEELIARRMDQLEQIEKLPDQDLPVMNRGNWDNPAAMKEGATQLRKNVQEVRAIYQGLLAEAKKEAK